MMTDSLPRRQLHQATERIIGRPISVSGLGHYVGDATFLVDHLADANDPVAFPVGQALETLEEIYAVALDRGWPELPPEEALLARETVEKIARVLEHPDQKSGEDSCRG